MAGALEPAPQLCRGVDLWGAVSLVQVCCPCGGDGQLTYSLQGCQTSIFPNSESAHERNERLVLKFPKENTPIGSRKEINLTGQLLITGFSGLLWASLTARSK